ncbi:PIN domain-containing protein [Streptomyces sp. NPDC001941]|uniref:PIN domain-containing protein n=1 Tax=Streptomyces sp. NPDC001941 TaxID=3154659 RepID=UPI00332EABAD
MRLRPGCTLDRAEEVLATALMRWNNLYSDQNRLWERYLEVVTATDRQLSETLAEPDLAGNLYNGHYWHLVADGNSPLLHGTLVREVQRQIHAMVQAQADLAALRCYAERPGMAIVYDTNALNHWPRPDEVKWADILREQDFHGRVARLVIPLVVIDELDLQKGGSNALSAKASKAIRYLEKTLDGTLSDAPAQVRPDATLEVRLDPPGHRRGDPDMEILLCAAELDLLGVPTRVLSNDFGLHLRARSMGLTPIRIPEPQHRKAPSADTDPS